MSYLTRRQFIRRSAAGLTTVTAAGLVAGCSKAGERKSISALPKRKLGKTGLEISMLAFGGGSMFLKNEDGEWEPVLQRAVEAGVNYFDTCSSYKWGASKSSEQRFGEILPQYRKDVIISTKFESREPDGMKKEVEKSLQDMNTDYVDILMIHSIEKSEDIDALEKGVYQEMLRYKEQGVAKFIGFSSMNSSEKSKEFMQKCQLDVVILAMNPTQYGDFAQIALPTAREKNIGVIAMKVYRDIVGKEATAQELLNYALTQDGVSAAVIGHYGMATLEENIKLVKEFHQNENVQLNRTDLENRLAHLAGPHALCWARPDYYDGKLA
ncbi:aldo/keto reductase [candidate division KSB1 bacterium]|nr:aldo/keto reductase [candidate division KSB1 bacterium]